SRSDAPSQHAVVSMTWGNIVPSILAEIISFCRPKELSRCSQVCKHWSNITLDGNWHEITAMELVHLFAILAPLEAARSQILTPPIQMVRVLIWLFKFEFT